MEKPDVSGGNPGFCILQNSWFAADLSSSSAKSPQTPFATWVILGFYSVGQFWANTMIWEIIDRTWRTWTIKVGDSFLVCVDILNSYLTPWTEQETSLDKLIIGTFQVPIHHSVKNRTLSGDPTAKPWGSPDEIFWRLAAGGQGIHTINIVLMGVPKLDTKMVHTM